MALTREQYQNAVIIYNIGIGNGMSARDIQIALITAMQESGLRNLNYGDRDSLGLFQQRPSQGWGTPEQVTNPKYAANKFYTELRKIRNRGSMSMTQAAQAVQRSAFPDAYAKHIPLIRKIFPSVQKGAGESLVAVDGRPYRAQPMPGPEPATSVASVLQAQGIQEEEEVDPFSVLAAPQFDVLAAPDMTSSGMDPTSLVPEVQIPEWAPIMSPETQSTMQTQFETSIGGFEKGVDGWRKGVVQAARGYLGTPYVWGGTSPSGFDCSGLVQYVYNKMGINLPRVSYAQANSGKRVGLGSLKAGDLVAWDNSSRNNGADHIAIYIGNGQIIEAPRPGSSVRIRSLGSNEGAWGVRIRG